MQQLPSGIFPSGPATYKRLKNLLESFRSRTWLRLGCGQEFENKSENKDFHRHVCIVIFPNPPMGILELPSCLSHEWLTFLKRCHWLVRQEYNRHVTMKVHAHFCINQNENTDDLYCNSNEFSNLLFCKLWLKQTLKSVLNCSDQLKQLCLEY